MFGMTSRPKPAPAPQKKAAAARKPARVAVTVKLDPAQRDKLELLGGEDWLRAQLDKASLPSPFSA